MYITLLLIKIPYSGPLFQELLHPAIIKLFPVRNTWILFFHQFSSCGEFQAMVGDIKAIVDHIVYPSEQLSLIFI